MAEKKRHIFPMPRTAFVLLMACVVLSVLPHLDRVPVWLQGIFIIVLGWRIQVFRQRLKFPPRWIRLLLVSGGFLGVVYHHGTVFGPDAGVGLLITAYLFKQMEMYTKRDAFLVVILSYFVLATEFLFSKSLYTSLYVFAVLVAITAALVALNQTDRDIVLWKPLKISLVSILQAIPLMLVLFFLFPRIGPIWELGMHTKINRTGLSDHMTPGDVAELSQSTKLAFRVEFDGPIPPPKERYWRAVVFDRFDGRTWYSQDDSNMLPFDSSKLVLKGAPLSYRVYLEPTGQRWLLAASWADIKGINFAPSNSLMYFSREPLDAPVSYQVETYQDYQYESAGLTRALYSRYTEVPPSGNSKSLQYARQLYRKLGKDPGAFSDAIHKWFYQENFVYTLKPDKLGADSVDDFLFSSRRGFCAHFAGAYVFMMRAVGIPARMVGGYQGGKPHPIGKYLLVHQYDAHAWAEYWVKGRGWVRVDPTEAVAPDRIELGSLMESLDEESLLDSPFSAMNIRNMAMLGKLRELADYVDYLWFKNVVSFDENKQYQLFKNLLGEVTPQKIAMLLMGCGGVVILILTGWMLYSHKPVNRLDAADKAYQRFLRKTERTGLARRVGEGPQSFAGRAAQELPESADIINLINRLYTTIKYAPARQAENENDTLAPDNDKLAELEQELKHAVARFKP